MHAHAHIRAHKCMLINASSYLPAQTYTQVHKHTHLKTCTHVIFKFKPYSDVTSFMKKKFIYHCTLISKCNNYELLVNVIILTY